MSARVPTGNDVVTRGLNERYVLGTVLERILTNDPDARFVGDTLTLEGAVWLADDERVVIEAILARQS